MNEPQGPRVLAAMRVAIIALLCAFSATALADGKRAPKPRPQEPAPQEPSAPQDPNQCTKVQGNASYVGMGYTHSITLRNGCDRQVTCSLWTDVDPEPKQTVQVRPGESVDVVTRRGSPARELTAFKECVFR